MLILKLNWNYAAVGFETEGDLEKICRIWRWKRNIGAGADKFNEDWDTFIIDSSESWDTVNSNDDNLLIRILTENVIEDTDKQEKV